MHCRGGYLPGGCTCQRDGTYQGGVPVRGGYLPGGYTSQGVPAQVLPPVNRMTDRCKNITLPQTSFAGGNKVTAVKILQTCCSSDIYVRKDFTSSSQNGCALSGIKRRRNRKIISILFKLLAVILNIYS